MMPGDDSLVFKSWVDPEGRGKLVLTEQTWHGSSTSANMCRNKVLFSQGGFFFSQLEKAQQCMGNKIFSVFSFPKMQLKRKGYLCVHWMREKKDEAGSSGKGAECVLSFTCLTDSLWVSGPETPLLSCPCSHLSFPTFPLGCALWMGTCRGLWPSPIRNNNLNSWPWCSHCSYMFCFPQRQDKTDTLKCQPDIVALV